jgi:hypothetical protein
MAKITQTVFVHRDISRYRCSEWSVWDLKQYQTDDNDNHIFVGTAEVTFDVPDDFDPRPAQVKALEAKERELRAQFAAAVTDIQRQISQLQAIEHSEAAL